MLCSENLGNGFSDQDPVVLEENTEFRRLHWGFTIKDVTVVQDRFEEIVAMKLGEVALSFLQSTGEIPCGVVWTALASTGEESVGSNELRAVEGKQKLKGLVDDC